MNMFKKMYFLCFGIICVVVSFELSGCAKNDSILFETDDFQISWLIEPGKYDDVHILSEDYIALRDNGDGMYAVADNTGKILTEFGFVNLLSENNGRIIAVTDENKFEYISPDGEKINDHAYDDALPFREEYAAVKSGGKWGFIDLSGKEAIPFIFDNVAFGFCEGLAAVEYNGYWQFIRKDGAIAFEGCFESAKPFSQGLAAVKQNGKWGYINTSGETEIECTYIEANNFSEGLAAVCTAQENMSAGQPDTWQYITKDGSVMFTVPYVDISEGRIKLLGEFKNGYALITSTLYCLIDRQGNSVIGDNSAFLTLFSEYDNRFGIIPAYEQNGSGEKMYGYVDITGKTILPFEYRYVSAIRGNMAVVQEFAADGNVNESKKAGVVIFKLN